MVQIRNNRWQATSGVIICLAAGLVATGCSGPMTDGGSDSGAGLRVFSAAIAHETHGFNTYPTALEDFKREHYAEGDEIPALAVGDSGWTGIFEVARENDWQLVHPLSTSAMPSGPASEETFEALWAAAEHSLRDDGPFDGISDEQLCVVRSHAEIGARILARGASLLLKVAARIALTHHERWDGTGYPLGLAGEEIPIEGRIVSVADAFDVLSGTLVSSPPLPPKERLATMEGGRGSLFDPTVLDAFFRCKHDALNAPPGYNDEC